MGTWTPIDSYQVWYSSNQFPPRVAIFGGATPLGQLIFMPDGSDLPDDAMEDGQVNLFYHLEDFANVLGLLRSELTLSLLFNGSGGGFENVIQAPKHALGT